MNIFWFLLGGGPFFGWWWWWLWWWIYFGWWWVVVGIFWLVVVDAGVGGGWWHNLVQPINFIFIFSSLNTFIQLLFFDSKILILYSITRCSCNNDIFIQ